MPYSVCFDPAGIVVEVKEGQTISNAAAHTGILLAQPCGGIGKCGRCKVRIESGRVSKPSSEEMGVLGKGNLEKGFRLACLATPQGDIRVSIPPSSLVTQQRLVMDSRQFDIELEPAVKRFSVELGPFENPDSSAVFDEIAVKLEKAYGTKVKKAAPGLSSRLESLPTGFQGTVEIYVRQDTVLDVIDESKAFPPLGLAIDLGTTKIAVFLVDLESGDTIASRGFINPQIPYGEDIISRLNCAIKEGPEALRDAVRGGINENLSSLLDDAAKSPEEIFECVIVGNTAMHHLFLDLPVESLTMSPYEPSPDPPVEIEMSKMNLKANAGAVLVFPPPIAGFVGSDHLAADLAVRLMDEKANTIVIDVGTNTEVSCKADGKIFSCSCASGPAFEGAGIRYGMRAAPGAIEWVDIDPETGNISLATIDDQPPVGICGSGILDAVSSMLKAGVINARGSFNKNYPGLVEIGGEPALRLAAAGEDDLIVVTQSDVREIQKAKGAMRAGIDALLEQAGIEYGEVEKFILAGAFGSYIDPGNAQNIGMLPPVDPGIIEQVGNAAGTGAREMLCSVSKRAGALQLLSEIEYLELISYPGFENLFASSMVLGEDAVQEYRKKLRR